MLTPLPPVVTDIRLVETSTKEWDMTARKLLPLSGLGFVVAMIGGLIAFGDTPPADATGTALLAYYDEHALKRSAYAFVIAATVPLLALFAIALAQLREGAARSAWELLALVGAAITGAGLMASALITFSLANAPDQGASGDAIRILALIDGDVWVAANASLGVLMLGAAGTMLGHEQSRRWLGWTALVLGIALFVPFADFVALLFSAVWISVVSVLLSRNATEPVAGVAPQSTSEVARA